MSLEGLFLLDAGGGEHGTLLESHVWGFKEISKQSLPAYIAFFQFLRDFSEFNCPGKADFQLIRKEVMRNVYNALWQYERIVKEVGSGINDSRKNC